MITIEEKKSKSVPGETSLFVSFDYNKNIVEVLKSFDVFSFSKRTKLWEFPLLNINDLLDKLTVYDDIELLLMKSKNKKFTEYSLMKYKTNPFDYQKDGIQFGLNNDKWLLLDPPGLGKTLQLIYLAQEIKNRDKIDHCLIICGINSLKMNWKKEIEKHSNLSCAILGQYFTKKGELRIGSGKKKIEHLNSKIKEFFLITNIESLRDKGILDAILKNKHNTFDMIIVDEIHTTKNSTSQQGHNLLKLNKAKYLIGATGTLMLNNPLDLYVPLKWIDSERSTKANFEHMYCVYDNEFNKSIIGYKNLKLLKSQLERCSLRRSKDLLNLPPKTIIEEYVEMDSKQNKFYTDLVNGIVDSIDKVEINNNFILSTAIRLRQATACPSILTSENINSAKIERAVDLANQIADSGEKVVIFSTFKETTKYLYESLKHLNPVVGTGDNDDVEISNAIDTFQNDDNCKVFIGTWQKCGTGITLTAASYMIFMDTPWTYALFEQNCDRIYRIGTKKGVTIYNLITKDTVDERVLEILKDKEALSSYIIDGDISAKGLEILKKYITEEL